MRILSMYALAQLILQRQALPLLNSYHPVAGRERAHAARAGGGRSRPVRRRQRARERSQRV